MIRLYPFLVDLNLTLTLIRIIKYREIELFARFIGWISNKVRVMGVYKDSLSRV